MSWRPEAPETLLGFVNGIRFTEVSGSVPTLIVRQDSSDGRFNLDDAARMVGVLQVFLNRLNDPVVPDGVHIGNPMSFESMLRVALDYSNAADDLHLAAYSLVEESGQRHRSMFDRCRERFVSLVIAAFIAWASGGAYAIAREP